MGHDLTLHEIIKKEIARKKSLSPMQRAYDSYKKEFIRNGGMESDHELLSYEKYKELNEKEESDEY